MNIQLIAGLTLCGLLQVFFQPLLTAQPANYRFETFELPGGILGNNVNCIIQDSLGFLWFASSRGLHRYDGHYFKTYLHNVNDPKSLSYSNIRWLCLAEDGGLWVGTFGNGLNYFDPATETAIRYQHKPDDPNSLSDNRVSMVTTDPDGMVWAATFNGLNRLDPSTGNWKRFMHNPSDDTSLSFNWIRTVYVDKQGALWVGAGHSWVPDKRGGLNRYNPKTETFTRYLHDPKDTLSLRDHRVRAILEDSRGNFWVGASGKELYLMDRANGTFNLLEKNAEGRSFSPNLISGRALTPFELIEGHISFIFEDQSQRIWIGSPWSGINLYDPATGHIQHFENDNKDPYSPSSAYFWNMYQTMDGSLWLATSNRGHEVNKLINEKKAFEFVDLVSLNTDAFTEGVVDLEPISDDTIVIATQSGKLIRYIISSEKLEQFQLYNQESIGLAGITSDQNGAIWIDLDDKEDGKNYTLIRFDPNKGVSKEFLNKGITTAFSVMPRNIGDPRGWKAYAGMIYDLRKKIWATTGLGLACFDLEKETHAQFIHDPDNPNSLSNGLVGSVFCDRDGKIWVGGGGSKDESIDCFIDYYDPNTGIFEHFKFPKELQNALVTSLAEDLKGNIWFVLANQGLGRLHPLDGSLSFFNPNNGKLPYNEIYELQLDKHGKLWFATLNDIIRFDPELETFKIFQPGEKGQAKQLLFSSAKNEKGELFWGAINGFYKLDPSKVAKEEKYTPFKVIITDFLLFDEQVLPNPEGPIKKAIWETETIRIDYRDNYFTFRFACTDFRDPEANRYEFKLEPYDPFWRQPEDAPSATYINVPPGRYTFRLRAANKDGVWGEEKRVRITIIPPWWQTAWAYAAFGLFLGSAIWVWYRFQKRRWEIQTQLQLEQKKALRFEELDHFKSRFYTNITHEFRTPLTIIKGMANEITSPQKAKALIQRNSDRLLTMINQMLDLSKLESKSLAIHWKQGDVIPFLKYLTESCHSMALVRRQSLAFFAKEESLVMDYDEEKLQQILINLLSNAIKFTPEYGQIKVIAERIFLSNGDALQITVEDTGKGIPADKLPHIFDRFYQVDDSSIRQGEGSGVGLALVQELIKLLGGRIKVQSEVGKGTQFKVNLPIILEANETANQEWASPVLEEEASTRQSMDSTMPITNQPDEKPLVLAIEDNPDVLEYIATILKKNYQFRSAQNGKAGLELAQEIVPDIILCDVMMPEMDGFDVCRRLKTDRRTSHIPIVLLTAKATQEDKVAGLSQGAAAYLTKPFDKAELLVRLTNLAQISKRLRARLSAPAAIEEPPSETEQRESAFLQELHQIIEANMDNELFDTNHLCRAVAMSRTQLHRKLKALTNQSTAAYIRFIRLRKAKALLESTDLPIGEIALQVGFKDFSHFSRSFFKEFGAQPSKVRS